MFAYCGNNPAVYIDPAGTKQQAWYQLFHDHDPGYFHRLVQLAILIQYNTKALLFQTEYVMPGIGRADIVCPSTGEMWEIKHGGSSPEAWAKGLQNANDQLQRYINLDCQFQKGHTGAFQGKVDVNFGERVYTVSYSTPEAGVILYTIEINPNSNVQALYNYAPHTLYVTKDDQLMYGLLFFGGGSLPAFNYDFNEDVR